MRGSQKLAVAVIGFLVSGCAGVSKAPDAMTTQALAPTGKLRVAFLATAPTHAIRDSASGEFKGPAVDLGREMARRIGVPFEPVAYTSFPPLVDGASSGAWDIAMMGISVERGEHVDFTPPYMIVEFGFLTASHSSISNLRDVDQRGVRIAVLERSSPDEHLSRSLRNPTVIRLPTLAAIVQSLRDGQVDAIYATKATVLTQSLKLPGSRVLEGHFGGEETAIAVPKRRKLALDYARAFVEEAKSEGIVKAAIDKAELRGVSVAARQLTAGSMK